MGACTSFLYFWLLVIMHLLDAFLVKQLTSSKKIKTTAMVEYSYNYL